MTSQQTIATVNAAVGWESKRPKRRARVQVEIGGAQAGAVDLEESVRQMRALWNELEAFCAEIRQRDDLIARQQAWLDRHEVDARWLGHDAELRRTIEDRKQRWVDTLNAFARRAERIVERLDDADLAALEAVDRRAPSGGTGVWSHALEAVPYDRNHPVHWPSPDDVPF